MPPPKKPDRLDEIEEALEWERPTDTLRRKIEQSGPPVSYPGRHWTPTATILVIGAASTALSAVISSVVPLLSKPDLTGYVKREEFDAVKRTVTERDEKVARAQRKAAEAWDLADQCRSQLGGLDDRTENLEAKPKRRR